MEHQKQVLEEIQTLLALIDQIRHAPEADVDQWYAENFGILTQAMDRLHQLLGIPSAGCDGQTAFVKKEDGALRHHEEP